MTRMNPVVKEKWLSALRSGQYTQGQGVLYNVDNDEYCCLGVLCQLALEERMTSYEEGYNGGSNLGYYGSDHELPPREVLEWAGLDSREPKVVILDEDGEEVYRRSLPELNDDYGYTFQQIADLVESQY